MVAESMILCVDNSEWMRNGDFPPNRLQAQREAASVVARFKIRENAETSVGLLTLADNQLRVPLTVDGDKIAKVLQDLEPKGKISFITGIRIAHLALKHRQNKHHRTKIVVFIASPIAAESKDLERLAKRLKKEKVHVDVILFGEHEDNADKLTSFINVLNGKEDKDSAAKCHLLQAKPKTAMLADILIGSTLLSGEGGVPISMGPGFDFNMDPLAVDDPELAMALRVSLEEQRQRQEEEERRVQEQSLEQMQTAQSGADVSGAVGAMAQARTADLPFDPELAAGLGVSRGANVTEMSEEEQLALALQMSMSGFDTVEALGPSADAMETDQPAIATTASKEEEKDTQDLLEDKDYLQSILSALPGVNPEEALQNLQQMTEAAEESKAAEEEEEGEREEDGQ